MTMMMSLFHLLAVFVAALLVLPSAQLAQSRWNCPASKLLVVKPTPDIAVEFGDIDDCTVMVVGDAATAPPSKILFVNPTNRATIKIRNFNFTSPSESTFVQFMRSLTACSVEVENVWAYPNESSSVAKTLITFSLGINGGEFLFRNIGMKAQLSLTSSTPNVASIVSFGKVVTNFKHMTFDGVSLLGSFSNNAGRMITRLVQFMGTRSSEYVGCVPRSSTATLVFKNLTIDATLRTMGSGGTRVTVEVICFKSEVKGVAELRIQDAMIDVRPWSEQEHVSLFLIQTAVASSSTLAFSQISRIIGDNAHVRVRPNFAENTGSFDCYQMHLHMFFSQSEIKDVESMVFSNSLMDVELRSKTEGSAISAVGMNDGMSWVHSLVLSNMSIQVGVSATQSFGAFNIELMRVSSTTGLKHIGSVVFRNSRIQGFAKVTISPSREIIIAILRMRQNAPLENISSMLWEGNQISVMAHTPSDFAVVQIASFESTVTDVTQLSFADNLVHVKPLSVTEGSKNYTTGMALFKGSLVTPGTSNNNDGVVYVNVSGTVLQAGELRNGKNNFFMTFFTACETCFKAVPLVARFTVQRGNRFDIPPSGDGSDVVPTIFRFTDPATVFADNVGPNTHWVFRCNDATLDEPVDAFSATFHRANIIVDKNGQECQTSFTRTRGSPTFSSSEENLDSSPTNVPSVTKSRSVIPPTVSVQPTRSLFTLSSSRESASVTGGGGRGHYPSTTVSDPDPSGRSHTLDRTTPTAATPTDSLTEELPFVEPTTMDLTAGEAGVAVSIAVMSVAGGGASPAAALTTGRGLAALKLFFCPSPRRKSDGKSVYLWEPLKFPLSLLPGVGLGPSDYPGRYLLGAILGFVCLFVLVMLLALYQGEQSLEKLKMSKLISSAAKARLSIWSTAPLVSHVVKFLSMVMPFFVTDLGIMLVSGSDDGSASSSSSSTAVLIAVAAVCLCIVVAVVGVVCYLVHSLITCGNEGIFGKSYARSSSSSSKPKHASSSTAAVASAAPVAIVWKSKPSWGRSNIPKGTTPDSLEAYVRALISSKKIGAYFFFGRHSWTVVQDPKAARAVTVNPPRGLIAVLGKVILPTWGPLHPRSDNSEEGRGVLGRFRTKYSPYFTMCNYSLCVLCFFMLGATRQDPERFCMPARIVLLIAEVLGVCFGVLWQPYIAPGKNRLMLCIEILQFIIVVLIFCPLKVREAALKPCSILLPVVANIAVLIFWMKPVLAKLSGPLRFVPRGSSGSRSSRSSRRRSDGGGGDIKFTAAAGLSSSPSSARRSGGGRNNMRMSVGNFGDDAALLGSRSSSSSSSSFSSTSSSSSSMAEITTDIMRRRSSGQDQLPTSLFSSSSSPQHRASLRDLVSDEEAAPVVSSFADDDDDNNDELLLGSPRGKPKNNKDNKKRKSNNSKAASSVFAAT